MTGTAKRGILIAAVSCGVLLVAQQHAYAFHKDSVPDWMRDAAKETLPTYRHDPNVVVLLDDSEYTVRPDGHVVLHERLVKKILRPQGRNAAMMAVPYNKDSKVDWMHVWSIGPDGHEYEVKDSELIDVAEQSSEILYADERARAGQAPAGDPGAVVAMEYEEQMPLYVPQISWDLQDEYPIHRNRLTLQLPPGFLYDAEWKRHDHTAPVDLGNNRWQWELLDTQGLDLRDVRFAPSARKILPEMTLHYAQPGTPVAEDWKSIGMWYQGLTTDRATATPEMVAKAQALTAGMTDFYAKAKAIEEFVQSDIRYVEIQIGVGGWQPHAASDIFRNRYGDCKDKATLLTAMLSAVGIHSTWLMVDSEGSIDPAMPSIFADHMISAIEVPPDYNGPGLYSMVTAKSGKRYLITDPTWQLRSPFGQIEEKLQGSYGLLMAGPDSEIIQIPVLDADRNTWTRSAHLKLAEDGSLSGDIVERLYGDEAAEFRLALGSSDEHQQNEILDHHVNADLAGFTLSNVKMENLREVDKDVVLSYTVSGGSYAKVLGPLLMVRSRVLGSNARAVDDKPRIYPIRLGATKLIQDDFEVQLPAGYVVDEIPEPIKMDVGFASYESKSTVDKDVLHYSSTYTVRAMEVPAKKYGDVKDLMGTIVNDEHSSVILRKTP